MKKILLTIILMLCIGVANAEIIIYDNITTSNLKILKIDDIGNIKYLNEYPYEIYINDSYYGSFQKNENILIPDNSRILIYASPQIKTDLNSAYDVGKVYLTLGIMYFIGFGILILLLVVGFKKIWR
jgi:hypothetical protein